MRAILWRIAMISKLKRRFTILATVSMFFLMAVLLLILNLVNYSSVVSESDAILDVLSQPNAPFLDGREPPGKPGRPMEDFIPRGMSPEVPYESRYFSVMVTSGGEVLEPDFSRIISVDGDSAERYISQALNRGKSRGFIGQFRYSKMTDERITRILFLDCGRKLDAYTSFLWTSVGVGLLGCIIVFVVFLFAAGRIVKPIAESYEKQKRFISDAGHEIKTPLTIINANVDLLESDGEKEELSEIRAQTSRLTELTNNLVYLSKMEESEHQMQRIEIPLSDIISETANSFVPLAASKGLSFATEVPPQITINGAQEPVRQLVSILLENALKYAPDGGVVTVTLSAGKKATALTVFNTTADSVREAELAYVFDRFYRADASRNSATGGHGIGLSIAKAIAEAHGGTISASTKNGDDFTVTVTFPR